MSLELSALYHDDAADREDVRDQAVVAEQVPAVAAVVFGKILRWAGAPLLRLR
jgi:hypothetical protein